VLLYAEALRLENAKTFEVYLDCQLGLPNAEVHPRSAMFFVKALALDAYNKAQDEQVR
jgi:hypothetical protein